MILKSFFTNQPINRQGVIMNHERFRAILGILPPMASINITFRHGPEGILGLATLQCFSRNGTLRIHECDGLIVAILSSNDWGGIDANRTFQVTFPILSRREEVSLRLYEYVDRVSPGQDSILSKLLSQREKMREQATLTIIDMLIPTPLAEEVSKWGFRINCGHRLWHELPQIYVYLLEGDTLLGELVLDATTGCIIEKDELTVPCTDIDTVQRRMRSLFTKYLDHLERETR